MHFFGAQQTSRKTTILVQDDQNRRGDSDEFVLVENVVGMFNGDVASSLRWEQVIRHLPERASRGGRSPQVGLLPQPGLTKTLIFGCASLHDVRGELMFGIRVDHHRVAQMVSLLASMVS